MVALGFRLLYLFVLFLAFSWFVSSDVVVCSVYMLVGEVCLPSGTTGSWVWVSARAMKSVASSVCRSRVDVLFLFLVVFGRTCCCCVSLWLGDFLLLLLCLFSFWWLFRRFGRFVGLGVCLVGAWECGVLPVVVVSGLGMGS